MKKSFVYHTLQVGSLIAVCSMLSLWASNQHVEMISNLLNEIDSLLLILMIAVALPYFCFKVLGKLYTPPKARNSNNFADTEQEIEQGMLYRGSWYKPEEMPKNSDRENDSLESPMPIKYRGANIANHDEQSSQGISSSFATERDSQKSAKPKERIKYRGAYVD
ncbi:hypothetical protein [Pseudanabaena mucicola]|uniref:Uncharacterized protein n=1 Tax=Pseudanabaena mucicola FACHB-723 TaxID=2692860 RepID=A0ABR7ZSU2_9CYAN|nr:hypothetical protein [Pseudanabaena mucicola]MBD2187016.1 hypothetical protein [Pseudanabaena mucicola FACHB-723]